MNWCWSFCAGFYSWHQAHYPFNLAWRGSFSQITNMVISLLIQTGSSSSDPADCHKALKQSVTLVWESNDEKWHTGAALTPESFPSLWSLAASMLFLSLYYKQAFICIFLFIFYKPAPEDEEKMLNPTFPVLKSQKHASKWQYRVIMKYTSGMKL